MKTALFLAILQISRIAHANCLNISGSYEIASGTPECSAGIKAIKAWKKYEQKDCKSLTFKKVYKLQDGSFCEGITFKMVDDGKETQRPGSEYALTYKVLDIEHVSKLRHVTNPSMSLDIHYSLDQDGNLTHQAFYQSGYKEREVLIRSTIQ